MGLYEDYLDVLQQKEGAVGYLYLDSLNLMTTGSGHRLETFEEALTLPWKNPDGSPSTPDQVRAAWNAVMAHKTPTPKKYAARYYSRFTSIRLTPDDVNQDTLALLARDFLPGVRRLVNDFEARPLGVRQVCVDIAWNAGVGSTLHQTGLAGFTHFLSALNSDPPDYLAAAKQSHRGPPTSEGRNVWAENTLERCAS